MIRYHPNSLNPYLETKDMKNFIANSATMNATTFPTIKMIRLSVINCTPSGDKNSFNNLYPVAANIVGTAKKNENSAASFLVSF